ADELAGSKGRETQGRETERRHSDVFRRAEVHGYEVPPRFHAHDRRGQVQGEKRGEIRRHEAGIRYQREEAEERQVAPGQCRSKRIWKKSLAVTLVTARLPQCRSDGI